MLRGGVILVTALFSKLILKRSLYKHHYIGCSLAFIGIALVGLANLIFPEE